MHLNNPETELAQSRRVNDLTSAIKLRRAGLWVLTLAVLAIWSWEYYAGEKLSWWPALFIVALGFEAGLRKIKALRAELECEKRTESGGQK